MTKLERKVNGRTVVKNAKSKDVARLRRAGWADPEEPKATRKKTTRKKANADKA